MENLIHFITPSEFAECVLVGMVNDAYQELSTKNDTRKRRRNRRI